jgi:polyferredoxin
MEASHDITMNPIKRTGIVLIYIGLIVFLIIPSLGDFELSQDTANNLGEGEKFEVLKAYLQPMIGHTFSTNFEFISALDQAFNEANQNITDRYAIPDQVIRDIISFAPVKDIRFKEEWINKAFDGQETEVSLFQQSVLHEYAGWLDGQSFETRNELKQKLTVSAENINRNIIYKQGFDPYSIKTLKFSMTRRSGKGMVNDNASVIFILSVGFWIIGALLYFRAQYAGKIPGIKNNHIFFSSLTSRGWLGVTLGVLLIAFYIALYFFPEYITNWVILLDPVSRVLNGGPASHWFLYGFLYTLAVLVMGLRMFLKYRHSHYHLLRTASIMFFQLSFAFIIPEILNALDKPGYDFKNIWPLDYDFFYAYNLDQLISSGTLGWFMLFWGLMLIVLAVPILTYFFGKRWYCSWVCGCGGLAETLGDPFRQLSDKSVKAWKIERWLIHSVLLFAIFNTAGVLYTYFTGSYSFVGIPTEGIKTSYGFLISSIFAGVVGTGFYPIMGNRVWCRFGCPLAAYMGIIQRFKSRFRITTNGGQCISCGNCSTYCEMGIDVRWYAQRGQNIIRASCVGCGICSAVCPRGVLRLENGKEKGRINAPKWQGNESLPTSGQVAKQQGKPGQ